MITAIVQFKLPPGTTQAKVAELFQGSAPKYQKLPGLVRKYYVFDEATLAAGGVYLWESREAANAVYTTEWRKGLADRYGAEPQITFFSTPVIVDNTIDRIMLAAAE